MLKQRRKTSRLAHPESDQSMPSGAVVLNDVEKTYGKGRNARRALAGVTEAISTGEFVAIMGPSGSGKSTLIQCAAGLDKPSKGSIHLGDAEITRLKEPALTTFRRRETGFIFQAFNLLPALTARENVLLPAALDGQRIDEEWLNILAARMGIGDLLGSRPTELSGGQQQRVAIARAIVSCPTVVFADEPTGALDVTSARATLQLLRQTVDELGQTMVMVTHDPVAASYADRVLFLADGRVVDRAISPSADSVARRLASLEG